MDVNRIYICHAISHQNQRDTKILQYLRQALQGTGTEIITDDGNGEGEDFDLFLQQKLPTCQIFILFQTPEATYSPRVYKALTMAQILIEKHRQQNILRFISTPGGVVPPFWSNLTTFDGTHDYQRAVEKMLLVTTVQVATPSMSGLAMTTPSMTGPALAATTVAPPPRMSAPKTPSLPDNFDRPLVPPSKLKTLTGNNLSNRRKAVTFGLIALVVMISVGTIIGYIVLNHPQSTTRTTGQVYFISSNQINPANTTGTCDELQINLHNLLPPATGHNYYAWLLPDKGKDENPTLSVGKLSPTNDAVTMTYTNPNHINLLLNWSRFLITEENADTTPLNPSPDQHTWRYYAAIPQTPNPQDSHHYSNLDHIRHLLVTDPTLQLLSMQGGLSTWFYENMQQMIAWSYNAQENTSQQNLAAVRHDVVRILDYIDGTAFVNGDVPPGTPIMINSHTWRIGLLTNTQINQDPPGYVSHIQTHLQGITATPDVTDSQRQVAAKIATALNKLNNILEQVHQDAKQLATMSDQQLASPAAATLMNDLVDKTTTAFVGQLDPTTGTRDGGATWIHDAIPALATLNVQAYQG